MGKIDQELWTSGVAAGREEARRVFGASAASGDASDGPTVEAVVKWFNADKGYGFVELSDGRGDAFLHLKTLRLVGRETLPSGARVRVVVHAGPRGAQVVGLAEVDVSTAVERPERAPRRPIPDASMAIDLTGKVKWFDGARGFGFVASDDFGKDVFIHVTTLGASGVTRLSEGQPVTMRVVQTPKGREAIAVTL
jgi:CspA family cold shock protein